MMRARRAFFLSPIIPAILPGYNLHIHRPEMAPLSGFLFICLAFYFLEAAIGIPAFHILNRWRWRHFWAYAVVGFLAVFVPLILWCLIRWNPSYAIGTALYGCTFIGIFGGPTGLIFCLLVRPDRDPVKEVASHFT